MILKICNRIVAYAGLTEEQSEIFKYITQCFIEKMVVFVTILIYGYLRNCTIYAITFYFLCTVIRKHSGGFHMDTFLKCYITSVLLVVGAVELNKFFDIREIFMIIFIINLISAALIMIIGCVNNPEMDMTFDEYQYNKTQTRQTMIIVEVILTVCIFLKVKKTYIILLCYAVICCAFFLILAKVVEHKNNDN